jgi:hypothetical protein
MTTSHDPNLQKLFTQAEQDFRGDSFAEDVLKRIDRERRKTLLVWSVLIVLALAGLALLASPVFTAIGMATQLLPVSLVEIETEWLRLLLSPRSPLAHSVFTSSSGGFSGSPQVQKPWHFVSASQN